jgi:hypothetical protein
MLERLIIVVTIALIGSALVPVVVLSLARLGHFPPVLIEAFGRSWRFAPRELPRPPAVSFYRSFQPSLTATTVVIFFHLTLDQPIQSGADSSVTYTPTSSSLYSE